MKQNNEDPHDKLRVKNYLKITIALAESKDSICSNLYSKANIPGCRKLRRPTFHSHVK